MGLRLIGAAVHPHWSKTLTYAERIVLHAMALTALDTESKGKPPELYYGGEEALIIALDGDSPELGTPAFRTRAKRVQLIIRRLVEVGAIERVTEGRRGQKAVYRLTLSSHITSVLPVHNYLGTRPSGGAQHPPTSTGKDPPNSEIGGS